MLTSSGSQPPDTNRPDDRVAMLTELEKRFAPEDEVLQNCVANMEYPHARISPWQGKLFQVLSLTCGARKILEIGTMSGYSGVWFARALPPGGKLISLELNPAYAEQARLTFEAAGLSHRTDVRIGNAIELLPQLLPEAPFDVVFIDADKVNNPYYLDWALKLTRPGSLIVADNIVRHGRTFQGTPPDPSSEGAAEYARRILGNPQLETAAVLSDDAANGIDGFTISVVRNKPAHPDSAAT